MSETPPTQTPEEQVQELRELLTTAQQQIRNLQTQVSTLSPEPLTEPQELTLKSVEALHASNEVTLKTKLPKAKNSQTTRLPRMEKAIRNVPEEQESQLPPEPTTQQRSKTTRSPKQTEPRKVQQSKLSAIRPVSKSTTKNRSHSPE